MKRLALALAAVLLVAAGDPRTETEHVVADGETLRGIANRAGVPLVVIAEANGLAQPYRVHRGQKLVIPRQRTHTVKAGETGSGIAERYGIAFRHIAAANRLRPDGTVRIGQKLIIPAVLGEITATPRPVAEPYFERPHDGAVRLGWAKRADGGGHDGIDFAVTPGDMVRAAAGGTVVFAGPARERYGQMVVIDHGGGWRSAYAHLGRVTVAVADTIRAGERLGIGGQSGDATRPELHFEIRRNGRQVDPAPFLRLGD